MCSHVHVLEAIKDNIYKDILKQVEQCLLWSICNSALVKVDQFEKLSQLKLQWISDSC